MPHINRLGKKTNTLHERTLLIIHYSKTFSFNELLEKDNSVFIHQKNLQVLAMETYKVSKNMFLTILSNIFAGRAAPFNLPNPVLKCENSTRSTMVFLVPFRTKNLDLFPR